MVPRPFPQLSFASGRRQRRAAHAVIDMLLELREIVDERLDQRRRSLVIGRAIRPGRARIEDGRIHARHRDRHLEAEIGIGAEFGLVQAAVERRAKLTLGEDDLLWNYYRKRVGHGVSATTKALVYEFYVGHPSIKRSPIASDVLLIKDEHGERQPVAKLLSEISLTDVYVDFDV